MISNNDLTKMYESCVKKTSEALSRNYDGMHKTYRNHRNPSAKPTVYFFCINPIGDIELNAWDSRYVKIDKDIYNEYKDKIAFMPKDAIDVTPTFDGEEQKYFKQASKIQNVDNMIELAKKLAQNNLFGRSNNILVWEEEHTHGTITDKDHERPHLFDVWEANEKRWKYGKIK